MKKSRITEEQIMAIIGKFAIHPAPLALLDELWMRATIGQIRGLLLLLAGFASTRAG